ncbi:MAG: hypothetical protein HKN12_08610 [Gemmatimonadetes bacterium]|nr:hypothetical protein [Gemmatimonadota bacterium]
MSVPAILQTLRRSMDLYDELAAALPAHHLGSKLPGVPSNTVGEQLWCVVGARESYARAIAAGEWAGFACSLTAEDCRDAARIREALADSARALLEAMPPPAAPSPPEGAPAEEPEPPARTTQLLAVLEHEAAHQGQLIRYLYALRIPVPPGWKARYALD